MYQVARKYVPPAAESFALGEHYTVTDSTAGPSFFREISFYRSPQGREVATDGVGVRLMQDGDLFGAVKAAVERYDAEHKGNEEA